MFKPVCKHWIIINNLFFGKTVRSKQYDMTKGFESFRRCSIAIKLCETPFLRYLLQACPQLCHHPIWQVPPWQLMGFEFGIPSQSTLRHWLAQCWDETSTGHEWKDSKKSQPHTHTWEEEDVKSSWQGICEKDPWLVKLLVLSCFKLSCFYDTWFRMTAGAKGGVCREDLQWMKRYEEYLKLRQYETWNTHKGLEAVC